MPCECSRCDHSLVSKHSLPEGDGSCPNQPLPDLRFKSSTFSSPFYISLLSATSTLVEYNFFHSTPIFRNSLLLQLLTLQSINRTLNQPSTTLLFYKNKHHVCRRSYGAEGALERSRDAVSRESLRMHEDPAYCKCPLSALTTCIYPRALSLESNFLSFAHLF